MKCRIGELNRRPSICSGAGGHGVPNAPAVLSQVQAGQLRAIAVAAANSHQAPARHACDAGGRIPRRQDEHLVRHLGASRDIARDRRQAACRYRADAEHAKDGGENESQGAQIFLKSPEEYAAYLQADATLMLELIKATNMTAQ